MRRSNDCKAFDWRYIDIRDKRAWKKRIIYKEEFVTTWPTFFFSQFYIHSHSSFHFFV
jgi:hypothetical protein